MPTHDYQKLEVWRKSIDLVASVYALCKSLPADERYGLCDQMKRAAVSIPSNIAEGQKRFGNNDTIHFCNIALGSLAELETQLIITSKVHGIETAEILKECIVVSRMLHALTKSLRVKS